MKLIQNPHKKLSVVVHAFNPSTWGTKRGRSLSSRLAWSLDQVPGSKKGYTEKTYLEERKERKIKLRLNHVLEDSVIQNRSF